jgi:maleate cis-trans isomerase
MYGWRARLGILVPSGNIVTEPEFTRVVPEGVSCHFHRFLFTGGGRDEDVLSDARSAAEHIVEVSRLITHVRPSVIAMTGTAVTFIDGHGYDQMIIDKIQQVHGNLPTTTTSTSVIDALNTLGVKRVAIAMPYIEEVARAAVKFVESNDIEVVDARWLNYKGFEIHSILGDEICRLARDVDKPESDALFISCTSLHTLDIIEKLEGELGKPVITSNQATIWNTLRLAGIDDKIQGFGRLLSQH